MRFVEPRMNTDSHGYLSAAEGVWARKEKLRKGSNKPLRDNLSRFDNPLIKKTHFFFIKAPAYLNPVYFLYQTAVPMSHSDKPTHNHGFQPAEPAPTCERAIKTLSRSDRPRHSRGFQPTESAHAIAFPSRSDGSRTWGFQSRRVYTIRKSRSTVFGPKVRADTSPVRRRTEGPFAGRESGLSDGTRAESPRKSPLHEGPVNLCGPTARDPVFLLRNPARPQVPLARPLLPDWAGIGSDLRPEMPRKDVYTCRDFNPRISGIPSGCAA